MRFVNLTLTLCIASSLLITFELKEFNHPVRPFLILICWFSLIYCPHCLAHYVVGRLLGVTFSRYTLSRSMLSKAGIPIISNVFSLNLFLTLKIKGKSSKRAMFLMFLSGPLASMLSPFVIVLIVHTYDPNLARFLAILTILNAIFTGYLSYKNGCIRKAIDSLK